MVGDYDEAGGNCQRSVGSVVVVKREGGGGGGGGGKGGGQFCECHCK